MKNKIILAVLGVLLIAGLVVSVRLYSSLSQKTDPPADTSAQTVTSQTSTSADSKKPEKAKDFYAFDLDGKKVSLSEKAGKPAVVNFWATWCPPCKAELPHFEKLYKELGDSVEFMMVDMTDGRRETVDAVKAFIAENGYTFPVYCDSEMSASTTYEVYSIPVTLFIDKDGGLSDMRIGALSEDALRSCIEKITDSQ